MPLWAAMGAPELLVLFRRFPEAAVRHALPALVFDLLRSAPLAELPPPLELVLLAWMDQVGLGPKASPFEVQRALVETYRAAPISTELRTALAEALRGASVEGTAETARAFASFVGTRASRPDPQLRVRATVRAGPLARFALEETSHD